MSYIHEDMKNRGRDGSPFWIEFGEGNRRVIVERVKPGGMLSVTPRGSAVAREPVTHHRSIDRAADRVRDLLLSPSDPKTW